MIFLKHSPQIQILGHGADNVKDGSEEAMDTPLLEQKQEQH